MSFHGLVSFQFKIYPRPDNVLSPSLMTVCQKGFKLGFKLRDVRPALMVVSPSLIGKFQPAQQHIPDGDTRWSTTRLREKVQPENRQDPMTIAKFTVSER